MLAIKF